MVWQRGNVATLAVEAPESFSRIFDLDKCDMQWFVVLLIDKIVDPIPRLDL